MRDLIGHLVARMGAERGAARIIVGIPQEFLSSNDGADRIHALIGAKSIGSGVFSDNPAIDSVAAIHSVITGNPMTIVYAGENIFEPANLEIAGAIRGFGLFD
jgi:hypothetical protein